MDKLIRGHHTGTWRLHNAAGKESRPTVCAGSWPVVPHQVGPLICLKLARRSASSWSIVPPGKQIALEPGNAPSLGLCHRVCAHGPCILPAYSFGLGKKQPLGLHPHACATSPCLCYILVLSHLHPHTLSVFPPQRSLRVGDHMRSVGVPCLDE